VGARRAGALQGLDVGGSETAFEATYRCAFKDWLNVQPDIQYIVNPGGNRRLGNALVVGIRVAFTASR
jgi:porin